MYVGRIVSVGMAASGAAAAMYRVSSRSFPNRMTVRAEGRAMVAPRPGHELDAQRNPYIAYNCLRTRGPLAVVSNGTHTDPIFEKLAMGVPPRDALALALLAMDFEKDHLDTPRIAGVSDAAAGRGWLGIVRKDALIVREMEMRPGVAYYLCTYERASPSPGYCDAEFNPATAAEAMARVMGGGAFAELENPVTACAAIWNGKEYDLAAEQ